jgi:hypothetical protein
VPGVVGIVTAHVRVVTPPPTNTYLRYDVSGDVVAARASQSVAPPPPLASVAVTVPAGSIVVALTVKVGGVVALKLTPGDVPPPGAGDATVTVFEPALAMSLAEIDAVNWVALVKVVGRPEPFHRTTDEETNPVPLTVSVKAGPPALTLAGESEVIAGNGLIEASTVIGTLLAASE